MKKKKKKADSDELFLDHLKIARDNLVEKNKEEPTQQELIKELQALNHYFFD